MLDSPRSLTKPASTLIFAKLSGGISHFSVTVCLLMLSSSAASTLVSFLSCHLPIVGLATLYTHSSSGRKLSQQLSLYPCHVQHLNHPSVLLVCLALVLCI